MFSSRGFPCSFGWPADSCCLPCMLDSAHPAAFPYSGHRSGGRPPLAGYSSVRTSPPAGHSLCRRWPAPRSDTHSRPPNSAWWCCKCPHPARHPLLQLLPPGFALVKVRRTPFFCTLICHRFWLGNHWAVLVRIPIKIPSFGYTLTSPPKRGIIAMSKCAMPSSG